MNKFTFKSTKIKDVYIVEPSVFSDERGYFMESYNKEDFKEVGLDYDFVQDNQSSSRAGVLRGLHFQKKHPQAKLVRVLSGIVFDVAVDLRAGSPTYGDWVGEILSSDNHKQLMIPKGFAHGFLVLSEKAEFAYKCDDFYCPEDEGGVRYDSVGIEWPKVGVDLILSEKDLKYPKLNELTFKF